MFSLITANYVIQNSNVWFDVLLAERGIYLLDTSYLEYFKARYEAYAEN